jgi:hypothetical protein
MLDGIKDEAKGLLARLASAVVDGKVDNRLGGTTQADRPRQIQLFASVNTTAAITTLVPLDTVIDATEQIPCFYESQTERLWRVRTSGVEIQRFSGGAIGPLTVPQIRGPAVPAGASRGGSVTFKFRVRICSLSGNYQFFMDAGQAIEVYGYRIQTAVVGPVNTIEVTPSNTTTLAGVLIDSVVGSSILAAEASLGQREVSFTEHLFVAQNTNSVLAVPEHARAVKVYTASGPAPAAWTRHIGDPAVLGGNLAVGTINFTGNTSSDLSNRLGDETHIQTDNDPANPRLFTIVWTIRP